MKKIFLILCFAVVLLLAIFLLFPVYWMVKGGFENLGSIMKIPPSFILRTATFDNYIQLFTTFPILRWTLNSLIIAGATVVISVFTSCLSGYAFAKKNFPGKNIIFWVLLSTMMIPFHVTIIPLFLLMRDLGLHNTYPGVFLPLCAVAGGMFLARQYMSTIPSAFIDSARIDGASEFRIFLSVIVPLSRPLIAALSIFSFVGAWGNFLWPLIMTSSDSSRTLPIGIVGASAVPGDLTNIGIAMAGATLVALPLFIVFFCFQKYFVIGLRMGAIKG